MASPNPRGTRSKPRRRRKAPPLGLWILVAVLLLGAAYAAVLDNSRPHVSGRTLTLSQFVNMVNKGQIVNATVLEYDSYVVGTYNLAGNKNITTAETTALTDSSSGEYNTPYAPPIDTGNNDIIQLLLNAGVPTTIDQQSLKSVAALGSYLLPPVILVVLFGYFIISWRRGTGFFAVRSGARRVMPDDRSVTFADVAGQSAAITEVLDVVAFLRDPGQFLALGARIPKGLLLFGPPGCGKTLVARAIAGEAGASFFSISGSDFVELYVGVGAARVRDLFREARQHAPSIIFVDEIDAIGRARRIGTGNEPDHEQELALNAILTEMDGFATTEGILVIGATNRPDILDQALLRPGRFDRTVGLERPDEEGRLAILLVHARGMVLDGDVDFADIAHRAVGLTGADLAGVLNEAAMLAGRSSRERRRITAEDLDAALTRVMQAPERQRRLSMRDRSVGRRFTGLERVTFADVAGADGAVAELTEVSDYLASPERFARLGARVPRGILISGPPGCGKTLLARAVAGEANAAFFSVAASEFVEIWVGQGAARVRDLFAEARAVPPAIVFLDELDAIGGQRAPSAGGGNAEMESTLNQILVELDGFEAPSGVIVMAATNRPDLLDAALVRPGRFDRRISLEPPDRKGRVAILALHARDKPLGGDVDLDSVARRTSGLSGADLAGLLNEAALLAARQHLEQIPMALVNEAVDRTVLGVAATGVVLSDEERRQTACHEAGHALVAQTLPGAGDVRRISIVRRQRTVGVTWTEAHDSGLTQTRSQLLDRMACMLAGRAAEQLVLGETTSGGADDVERSSRLARHMVTQLGMSEALGPIVYDSA
ncbi:MAG: ATP-dependent metallopeptidase FtsH/Yme1/Tma family protein, partial [Candidatus Dormibacteraeota bacterium]|nr:ATP-dependent metallopeptidase FtsH/Yme1/Tma family protein [Candidatus Dormibacteraeota bacterium]